MSKTVRIVLISAAALVVLAAGVLAVPGSPDVNDLLNVVRGH